MSRNFYVGRRETVGGNQSPGSYIAHDTQRELNSVAVPLPPGRGRFNSLPQQGEPFIHGLELGSSLLFLFVVLLPIAIVGGLCIGYAAFVPQSVEYQVGVYADR